MAEHQNPQPQPVNIEGQTAVTDGQGWFLVVEVGVIAAVALLRWLGISGRG